MMSVTASAEHLAGRFPKQVTPGQGGEGHNDTVGLVVKGEILPLLIKICPRNTLLRRTGAPLLAHMYIRVPSALAGTQS